MSQTAKMVWNKRGIIPALVGGVGLVIGYATFKPLGAQVKPATLEKPNLGNAYGGLKPKEFSSLKLAKVETVNHDSKVFHFALPEKDARVDFPVMSYVATKSTDGSVKNATDGKEIIRPYTPIHSSEDGHLSLLVKDYPSKGNMSSHIHSLKVGDSLDVKGPLPKYAYEPNSKTAIGMIAGGSGITPFLQLIEKVTSNPYDKTELTLLFANHTPADILLKDQIDKLVKKHHPQLKVHYIVSKAPGGWNEGQVGRFTAATLKEKLPAPSPSTMVMVCGPPSMMVETCGPKAPDYSQGELAGHLKNLGYTKEMVLKV